MRLPNLSLVCLLLVGCSGSASSSPALPVGALGPETAATGSQKAERLVDSSASDIVYSFTGAPNGGHVETSLLVSNGVFYGTAYSGGASCRWGAATCGIIYELTPSGSETILHSFAYADGCFPSGPLVAYNGSFYGVAQSCGKYGDGVVYSITPTKHFAVLYNFTGKDGDGSEPSGALLQVGGTFYGTTTKGGDSYGTVFALTAQGQERVLHRFGEGVDGQTPNGSLTVLDGSFWGTTEHGGAAGVNSGTIFAINPDGNYKQIYSFKGNPDGAVPLAGLVVVNGTIYGTTLAGGKGGPNTSCPSYCGTVFSATATGEEHVIYAFSGGPGDGMNPEASLTYDEGNLYGTTFNGGPESASNGEEGFGTAFKVSYSGQEQVLHFFQGSPDGESPTAALTVLGSALYGTTTAGGAQGWGSAFTVAP